MASMVPPQNGVAFIFYVTLVDQSNTKLMKSTPTLAAGDVRLSIDGAALADLATLPTVTPAAGRRVKVSLSAAEMTGDNIGVLFSDVSGAEWCDLFINIQTSARRIDDLAYPATTGRSLAVDASGQVTVGAIAANAITTTAINDGALTAAKIGADAITAAKIADGAIDAATFAAGAINAAAIATDAITAAKIAADAIGASELAADAVTEIQSGLATTSALSTVNTTVNAIAGYVDTEVAAIKAKTDNLPADPADASDIAAAIAPLATAASVAALNNLSAAQVKAQADQALADAGVTTTVTGRIDAAISSRNAIAPDNADIALIKAKTDNLPPDPADASDIAGAFATIAAAIAGLNIPSASAVAAAVWASGSRTLTSFGTLVNDIWSNVTRTITGGGGSAADVWGYSLRTLTQTATQVAESMGAGGDLHIIRAVTFGATLTGLNIPSGRTAIFFTAKRDNGRPDTDAIIQIKVSNPAAGDDGLLRINKAAATNAADGSLVVDDGAGTIAIALADDATVDLVQGSFVYDLKALIDDGSSVLLAGGSLAVASTATEAVV